MARRRDTRTYITVHDSMPDHPKIEGLSDAAFRLLVRTWCWCSRHLTDGQVRTWERLGTPKSRRELVEAGLVEVRGDGTVWMHDYLEHQRSAAEVRELSEKRAEAGKKGGKNRASAQANAKQGGKQVLDPLPSKTQAESDTELLLNEATRPPAPTVPPTSGGARVPAHRVETDNQRAQRLTKAYTDRVPLSRFPAVMGVVKLAIHAGKDDDEIVSALTRLAAEGRSVTAETLRIEIEGLPAVKGGSAKKREGDRILQEAWEASA